MIYLTQIIYLNEGEQEAFNAFEAIALPAMEAYGGRLHLRLRPNPDSIVAQSIEVPYEIHIISFNDEDGLRAFIKDEKRQENLHLKEKSVKTSYLYKGIEV